MRTVKIRGLFKKTEIRLFDSIKDITVTRDHEFWRLVLQDVGIGSDMKSFDNHLGTLYHLLHAKDLENAAQEVQNLRSNIFYMIEKVSLKSFCFVTLIESINGVPYIDLSDEGVKSCLKELSRHGLKASMVEEQVEDIKKNLRLIFGIISPTNTAIQA